MNKEKHPAPNWMPKGRGRPTDAEAALRVRDVIYWYIDYREFANVVKYRIAMMRKGIDEQVKQVDHSFPSFEEWVMMVFLLVA